MTEQEIIDKAALELFIAHNPKGNPLSIENQRIIDGFKKDVQIIMLWFDVKPKGI